jgi:hypothetical protein
MNKLHIYDISKNGDFQREFKGYYKVRRGSEFCDIYFDYMEKRKSSVLTFKDVLKYLFRLTARIEPSFSSKLLATINPDMPVWDSHVLSRLAIVRPQYRKNDKQKQLIETIETYLIIENWYRNYLKTQNANDVIGSFDEIIPNTSITNVKKIDLVLWSMGKRINL